MAHTKLHRAGSNTLRFIGKQQQKGITNRNRGVPVLKPKIKLSKRKKTLRGAKA
jgi:hypothetical protein